MSILKINDWQNCIPRVNDCRYIFNLKGDSEFIPLASIFFSGEVINLFNRFMSYSTFNWNQKNVGYTASSILSIYKDLNVKIESLGIPKDYRYDRTYDEVLFPNISNRLFQLRSGTRYYANKFLLTKVGNSIEPLYMMVIRRSHIRYVRQCLVLGEEIHPEAVKLLVNNKFDVVRSRYRLIRPRYRKYIKKPLLEKGVEIIEVENFDDIFVRPEIPKSLGIGGYEKKLNALGKEFLEYNKLLNKEDSDFTLTY